MRRHHRIPAAFLAHPPPSWGRGRRRRNPIIRNPIIRNARHRRNPFLRNPRGGGIGMMPLLLIGGGVLLFMNPGILSRFTSGATRLPAGVPAGSVRLADGTWRTPTGQILGTPVGTSGYLAPLLQAAPALTGWLANLFSGFSSTGTIVSGVPSVLGTVPGDVLGTGASTVTAPDILTGAGSWGIGDPLPPIPTLPDLTLSDWWTGGVPSLDLTLMPIADQPALVDPYLGFMGLGRRVVHVPMPPVHVPPDPWHPLPVLADPLLGTAASGGYPITAAGWSRTLRRPPSFG